MQKSMPRESRFIFKTHNEGKQSCDSKQSLSNSKAQPLIRGQHCHFKLCCWQDVVAHASNVPGGKYKVGLYKFKASLVYEVSFKTPSSTQGTLSHS